MKRDLEPYQLIERSIIKKYRKELWTPFIVAVKRYELVQAGDRIAVCISGGKDSMLMAKLMQELQRHSDVPFELVFLVMDPGYNEINRQKIESNAELLHIPVTIFESNIFAVANNTDKNPCYLCARMRRGHLYSKAQELGCTSTSFTCVHGLYDYGNVSSARDLALIASACAANETYMKVANTLSYTLPATNLHQNERSITSTNLMLNPEYPYYRDYIRGMKTGFTTLAGRCYVTFAQKNGHTYGLVILGSDLDNIYKEASELLDWAFASFADRRLVDTTTPLTTVPLTKCRSAEAVELYAAEPVSGYGHADDKVTYSFALPERVSATVKADAVLGQATVYLDGYEVGTVDLVTHQEYVSDFRTDLKSTLLLMAALMLLLAVLSCVTLVSGGSSLNRNRRRRANRK